MDSPGYNGSKRADKRNESGQDDGFGTVLGVKLTSGLQMVFFKQKRIGLGKDFGAEGVAGPIANVVTENRGRKTNK